MKNSDQPAIPISPEQTDSLAICITESIGLTKREYFAGLALQGLLSGDVEGDWDAEGVASEAVLIANKLLKQLEES